MNQRTAAKEEPASPHAELPASQVPNRSWPIRRGEQKRNIPEGLWIRCDSCSQMVFRKSLDANLRVCPECGFHYRISAKERVEQLCDPNSFEPEFEDVLPTDPLHFEDRRPYGERLDEAVKQCGRSEAVYCGRAFIKGRRLMLACLDLTFMMGSMGTVVGERLTRTIEAATETDLPLVIVSCGGGARMQESGLSLMQMAKTSAALARLDDGGGLYISVLTDPTTGGISASFAMLGDVIFAEPGALIGFAGPRVIEQTIRQSLPQGFQRSEFLLEAGFIDRIVHRKDLRTEISRIIDYAGK
ncbi:MAG: acetyl-CoA carboxylase carboxyltransferase subunit beta [Phycisphaerales bacterium]|nr:acetyl-CoA carboxylase carboxyltransferase subunit beta [Phycisphaerales bacterium]